MKEALGSINILIDTMSSPSRPDTETVPVPASQPGKDLRFMLPKLKQLLEKNSFSAESYLQSIVMHLEPHSPSTVKRLSEHVNRLEFKRATSELESLAKELDIDLS